jgi:hypothetical protein
MGALSLQKVHSTRKFLQEYFKVSLRKLPRSTLFLPGRTRTNKKVFEFNHELLGGLSIRAYRVLYQDDIYPGAHLGSTVKIEGHRPS